MKINVEKTEVLHIGLQREELDIELEGEETDSGRQFRVSRRGSVRRREDGEREVRRRVQAGAIAWRAVEEVMADRGSPKD